MQYTVLSRRAIAIWAVLVVMAGVGVAVWLLLAYGSGDDPRVQLDAIRTAGTLVVGAGGAAALLLAARRQRSIEIALKQKERDQADAARTHALQERIAVETRTHQERVAAATEYDAAQRRVTDLYTAAAAQLGSDKAPVRLAGLYALERLAQDNPAQRQMIVDVLCAYLRMPYALPEDPSDDPPDGLTNPDRAAARADHTERVQEREVRLTAQRVLARHLRPGEDPATPATTFWADVDLDLTGATLIDLDFTDCVIRETQFARANFIGNARFDRTTLGPAWFDQTTFTGQAWFVKATFTADTRFDRAVFTGDTRFDDATLSGKATFHHATFTDAARFEAATFNGYTVFAGATFTSWARFDRATFSVGPWFHSATFHHNTMFTRATFATGQGFNDVTFPTTRYVDHDTPWPWLDFTDARFGDSFGPREIRQFPHTTVDQDGNPEAAASESTH